MNKNPYFITEPAVISFSGGRSSAYMLYKCIEAHNGKLPDYVKVCFANTGKEMPQTLDFVRDCGEQWGVDIVWLESNIKKNDDPNIKNKFLYRFDIVDYKTASRNGEPFEYLLQVRQYLPNPVARFCTKDLKLTPMKKYMSGFFKDGYLNYIGIRGDELRRAAKLHNKVSEGNMCFLPMFVDGVTKQTIFKFWSNMDFDLQLHNNNGTTDFGNCDLCFLKGYSKKLSIIREMPHLADWWARMEKQSPLRDSFVNSTATFRKDQPNYEQMKIIATDQGNLFDLPDDETIPCFCGD